MNLAMISKMSKTIEKFAVDNAPTMLTAVGVIGTAATAVLTYKGTKAATLKIVDRESVRKMKGEQPLSRMEIVTLTWKEYVPPTVTGVGTIAAIVFANHINAKRAAAMAVAYSMSQKSLEEYKEKVVEKIGKGKEQGIRDEIAQDHVDRNPVGKNEVFITGGGEVLCYDKHTGRYFMSSMEALKRAENDINFEVLNNQYAYLNDFYRLIGLPTVPMGEEIGWTIDMSFTLNISTTISEDKKPCLVVDYQVCGVRQRPSSPGLKAVGHSEHPIN